LLPFCNPNCSYSEVTAIKLGKAKLCQAIKRDPFFSIKGSQVDRISEFSELPQKEMNQYSGGLNEAGWEWWILP
jgi:hypothetical protein